MIVELLVEEEAQSVRSENCQQTLFTRLHRCETNGHAIERSAWSYAVLYLPCIE